MQAVYRRVVGVVGLSIQNPREVDFGDCRQVCAVGRALKVTCLSSFEVLVQANVIALFHSLLKYTDPLQFFLCENLVYVW